MSAGQRQTPPILYSRITESRTWTDRTAAITGWLEPVSPGTFYRSSDHGALLPAAGLLWTPSEDGCGTVGPAGPTRVASIARSLPSVTRALLGSTHGSDSSELGSGLGKLSQRLPPLGALGLVVAGQISADAACPLGRRTRHASRITHHPSPTHAFAD